MEVTPNTHIDEMKKFVVDNIDGHDVDTMTLIHAGQTLEDDVEWQDFVPFTWLTAQIYLGKPKVAAKDYSEALRREKEQAAIAMAAEFEKSRLKF